MASRTQRPQATNEAVRKQFTADEYRRMTELKLVRAPDRTELLAGTIYEKPPPSRRHESHVSHLSNLFHDVTGSEILISVENRIELGASSTPRPDVVLLRERRDLFRPVAPTSADVRLVVEIVEFTSDFQFDVKLPVYAAHEIPAVWLVDLSTATVVVHTDPVDGHYGSSDLCEGFDVIELGGPPLRLRAGELFAKRAGNP